jgi:nitrate reductase molybdenum cofactor assembly chaperone NarJ/NarW
MRSAAADLRTRVIHQVASACLAYPDDDLLSRLPLLRTVLAGQPTSEPVAGLSRFVDYAERTAGADLQRHYVALFDFDRKHALPLSYWTDGDTRRRGSALAEFKRHYRDSGWVVDTGGELPDHLPMVLEFAALVDPAAGRELLLHYRAGLELLRLALIESSTPYADLLVAVCATLPGPSPRDRAAARALAAAGPPTETVGLEPYGALQPRLLPLSQVGTAIPVEVR